MKKNILTLFSVFLFLNVFAANKYWVGTTGGQWTDVNNWSLASNGAPGAAVPTTAGNDVAIFDGKASLGVPAYTAMTVDVTGATIAAGSLQINAGITLTFSGAAASISFSGQTNGLVLLGYFNDGGNTIKLGGNIAYSYSSSTPTAVSPVAGTSTNTATYTFAANVTSGVQIGSILTSGGGTNTTVANGQLVYVTAVTSTTITVNAISPFVTALSALNFGPLGGVTTLSAAAASGASTLSVASTSAISPGTNITSRVGMLSVSTVTSVPSAGNINISPYTSAAKSSGDSLLYFNGASHTGTGKLQMFGGTGAANKIINANNLYAPSFGNIEIGDGTTPAYVIESGGGIRVTGSFKVNKYSWFFGTAQVITMYDAVNNTNPPLILADSSFTSIYNKTNGFAAVATDAKFGNNPMFYFGPGGNLSSLVTCSPTSTVTDSISSNQTTQNTFVSAPITYGNLNIYSNASTTGGTTFASNQTATVKGTLTVFTSTGGGVSLSSGTLVMAPSSRLVVNSGATFNLNGKSVTLQSDATGTAAIGTVAGTLSNATNVTVQRYIPSNGRKSYTMVTSPVSGPIIRTAWQEAGATIAGFGTQITGGTVGNAAANGFDTTSASGLSSIYTYNDANASGSKWVGLSNTNVNTLAPGAGYLLYVRGDRAEARNITGTSSNTTLRATGTITIGNFTPVLTTTLADKFNLVANPYASAITWTGLTKANLTGSFYVYDPNLAVFVTSNGITVSPSASKQRVDTLQSGQAFFIQNASSGTPSITFTESAKVGTGLTASANTVFSESSAPSQLNINVYNKSNELADGVVALFGNDYKAGLGKEDAAKMDNFNETFSLTRNNTKLSIEGRPLVKGNDTLFFAMSNFGKKEYVLQIDGSNFSEAHATLIDNYTGTKTALDLAGITAYNFAVNGDAASAGNERFMITFGTTATIAAGETTDNNLFVKVSPNPVSNQLQVNFKTATTANAVINVINSLGQTVRTVNAGKVNAGNITIATADLSAGIYTVQLISGDKKIAVQKIVKD